MFKGLQKKWKVSGWRVLIILVTFAIGGSLTGYLGRKIMSLLDIHSPAVYAPVYIVVITLVWPLMVLVVSIFTGQFSFFRTYIAKMGRKLTRTKNEVRSTDTQLQTPNLKHLVIFASGAGSNAKQIIHYFRDSGTVKVDLIVCNKPGAGVLSIAEKEGIPTLLIEKERFFRGDGYLPLLRQADLIILAGFLWKMPRSLTDAYPRRIVNIHPALLPGYGGRGMYGRHVHEAVIGAGEPQSGITIHYVDEHYDNGDIIFQAACPVLPGDTPETLAARIHQLEHLHYPREIEKLIAEA